MRDWILISLIITIFVILFGVLIWTLIVTETGNCQIYTEYIVDNETIYCQYAELQFGGSHLSSCSNGNKYYNTGFIKTGIKKEICKNNEILT